MWPKHVWLACLCTSCGGHARRYAHAGGACGAVAGMHEGAAHAGSHSLGLPSIRLEVARHWQLGHELLLERDGLDGGEVAVHARRRLQHAVRPRRIHEERSLPTIREREDLADDDTREHKSIKLSPILIPNTSKSDSSSADVI